MTRQEYREMGDSQRLFITKKAWLLNGWVDGWIDGLKLNYNGGPFSKMVRFLKFKFQTILKLNFNGGQFKNKIKLWLLQKIVNFPLK